MDVQWAQLAALVELSLKHALVSLHGQIENASHGFDGHGLRPKGSLAAVVPALRPCGKAGGARLQRLAAFLGRLHEAVRVQNRPVEETRALLNKIAATWPSELAVSTVEEAIPECEALILRLRQQRRDHSLSSWRNHMAQAGRDATRWLKNKAGLLVPALSWTVGANTSTSTSTAGSLEMLVSFWEQIWHRPVSEDHDAQLARLWDGYPPPQAAWPGDQGPLRDAELLQRARAHSQSSASPDGISPELKRAARFVREAWRRARFQSFLQHPPRAGRRDGGLRGL